MGAEFRGKYRLKCCARTPIIYVCPCTTVVWCCVLDMDGTIALHWKGASLRSGIYCHVVFFKQV